MTDLLTRLQDATEETQWAAIHCVLARAHRLGWITTETFVTAREWGQSGAFVAAALTLVPGGMAWSVSEDDTATACINMWGAISEEARAPTPALALCIAALQAQQSKAEVA